MKDLVESYRGRIPDKLLDDFEQESSARNLSKKDAEKVLQTIKEYYDAAKIDPGESIGIITAESFGEPGTQMALNVFHFAGVAEVSVSQGLPRIIEIFDARKEIKTPRMEIYLLPAYNKDPVKVRKIASLIKEISLREVSTNFSINLVKLQLEITLNKKKMKDINMKEEDLVTVLSTALKKVDIKVKEDVIYMKLKSSEDELLGLYQLKEKAKETYVSGVKGVSHVLPVKNKNEFIILTMGSNLKEVLLRDEVDDVRTTTNDLGEVKKVLGIEAARNAIIRETMQVYEDQGLEIDIRHMMLIADIITHSGMIRGITRSGITGQKESVLARASFETPIKHIINASLIGEEDRLNSVIENVIVNQTVPLGTGLPDLITKLKEGAKKWQQQDLEKY